MMVEMISCEVAINDADAALLAEPDFFRARRTSREQIGTRDWYYRQADSGRVFLIRIDTGELADDVLDVAEAANSEAGEDVAEDVDRQVSLDRGLRIAEVGANVLERADAVGLDEIDPTLADWLVAAADAIDEADGCPDDVLPPLPSTLH
jgi:hypothetical protein